MAPGEYTYLLFSTRGVFLSTVFPQRNLRIARILRGKFIEGRSKRWQIVALFSLSRNFCVPECGRRPGFLSKKGRTDAKKPRLASVRQKEARLEGGRWGKESSLRRRARVVFASGVTLVGVPMNGKTPQPDGQLNPANKLNGNGDPRKSAVFAETFPRWLTLFWSVLYQL